MKNPFMKEKEFAKVDLIDVHKISSNKHQPRQYFSEASTQELAISIKENGLLQPISVRRMGDRYELISGERRLRAVKLLHLERIPAVILGMDDRQSAILALVENIQREDLSYFEEAEAILRLTKEMGLNQTEIAKYLGKSQSTVANKLRLLKFSPGERKYMLDNGLTERHARALLKVENPQRRKQIIHMIIDRHLNVAQTEKLTEGSSPLEIKEISRNKRQARMIPKDVRLFLNSIDKAFDYMKQAGIQAVSEKNETEEFIEYHIKIPKGEKNNRKDLTA